MTRKQSEIINCGPGINAAIAEIQSDIEAVAGNSLLYAEKSFDERTEAIDFIAFQIIDHIESLLQKNPQSEELILLKSRTEKVKTELEEIDINLFKKLRGIIRTREYTAGGFRNLVDEYVGFNLDHTEHQQEGYDNLDFFINGLFHSLPMPEQTKDLEPEMVFYQKTPARIVFELVEKVHFAQEDIFFDVGSGFGQAAVLVSLLRGVKAIGIEFEPAFCDYARDCAAELNLPDVTFINVDARKADYSSGSVFFMYTPFKGEMLQEVLAILKKESLSRKIRIISYGPCTTEVALQSWLDKVGAEDGNIYKLAVFESI